MPSRSAAGLAVLLLAACSSQAPPEPQADPLEPLKQSLTFYAPFDEGLDAAYAQGDRRIYSAPSYKELDQRSPGHWGEDVTIAYDKGRYGHALQFHVKNTKALFFTAEKNVPFSESGWTGTVSFWLSLDPAVDLEPGFCDPIQVTDKAYNDGAIWTDFTKDNPRQFRLGVFGDLEAWNPENKPNEEAGFDERLVVVNQPPFASGKWTHVVIVYDGLGTPSGKATLYLDAKPQGTSEGISEAFTWDMATAAIRLGVNYVGLWDELSVFSRPLTAEEVTALHNLEHGVQDLR
ncbi:MAG: LamG domain-containing protein [Bryobacterales bacterium]